jgi:DNA replication protein DnaC
MLATTCRAAGQEKYCSQLCYGWRYFHGASGGGGIWKLADIPKSYGRIRVNELPFAKENPVAYTLIKDFCGDVIRYANKGRGLYLYSVPNPENPKGTGTGKTTAAVTILNEFLVARVAEHIRDIRRVDDIPGMFVNVSKYQNLFNSQFRGTKAMQEEASDRFYYRKGYLISVELLVLDDIGVRDATEAFMNEMYEVIDERTSEQRATIFTSNVPLESIAASLDDRIASRIEGMSTPVFFEGRDHRKGVDEMSFSSLEMSETTAAG